MNGKRSTLVRSHPKANLWRIDRQDPSGNPVSYFEGVTFMDVEGERRATPAQTFNTSALAAVWYEKQTGEEF